MKCQLSDWLNIGFSQFLKILHGINDERRFIPRAPRIRVTFNKLPVAAIKNEVLECSI
jgi:hypothetical protein